MCFMGEINDNLHVLVFKGCLSVNAICLGIIFSNWNIDWIIFFQTHANTKELNSIKVVHELMQPYSTNPCGKNFGNCEHMCILTAKVIIIQWCQLPIFNKSIVLSPSKNK